MMIQLLPEIMFYLPELRTYYHVTVSLKGGEREPQSVWQKASLISEKVKGWIEGNERNIDFKDASLSSRQKTPSRRF